MLDWTLPATKGDGRVLSELMGFVLRELSQRGYDETTVRFSIQLRPAGGTDHSRVEENPVTPEARLENIRAAVCYALATHASVTRMPCTCGVCTRFRAALTATGPVEKEVRHE